MIKYCLAYLFILMSVLYGEISLDSLVGNYCYPNCKKSNSILMINSDSTFNFKTMLHGGFSKAGTLQILKDKKVPWPYPRGDIWARAVDNLSKAGAKVIVFDIQF